MYGKISEEEFNRNKHNAFLSLLDEAISFKEMEPLLTEETQNKGSETVMNNKVFIVHGHNDALKYQLADWLRKIEIEPIILHEQANMGITSILGKIEKMCIRDRDKNACSCLYSQRRAIMSTETHSFSTAVTRCSSVSGSPAVTSMSVCI